jgi:hypothetical protein
VQDDKIAEVIPFLPGKDPHQILLDLDSILVLGQAKQSSNTLDVRIDNDPGIDAICSPHYAIRSFPADSRECDQILERSWHLSRMTFDNGLTTSSYVLCLHAEEAGRTNLLFKLRNIGRSHRLWVRILLEQAGSDHIDPHIRALGREDGGDQKFIRTAKIKGGRSSRKFFPDLSSAEMLTFLLMLCSTKCSAIHDNSCNG